MIKGDKKRILRCDLEGRGGATVHVGTSNAVVLHNGIS